MRLSELEGRILSRPMKVRWAGWESDTYSLQQAGWDLSVDQDICHGRMRMVIRHGSTGMIGQTQDLPYDYLEAARQGSVSQFCPHIWQMRHLGGSLMVTHGEGFNPFHQFHAIDAKPQYDATRIDHLEDLVHFAKAPLVRTTALVLPEATVDDLLKEILERQQEAKLDYFRDVVQQEGALMRPHKFHAQIISLGDYKDAA